MVQVQDSINLAGEDSGILANATKDSTGDGGSIFIIPDLVNIEDGC